MMRSLHGSKLIITDLYAVSLNRNPTPACPLTCSRKDDLASIIKIQDSLILPTHLCWTNYIPFEPLQLLYKKITLSRSKEGSDIPGTNVHCCFGTTQFQNIPYILISRHINHMLSNSWLSACSVIS